MLPTRRNDQFLLGINSSVEGQLLELESFFFKTLILSEELYLDSHSQQHEEDTLNLKKISAIINETLFLFHRDIYVLNDFKTHFEKEVDVSPSKFEIVACSSSKEVPYFPIK